MRRPSRWRRPGWRALPGMLVLAAACGDPPNPGAVPQGTRELGGRTAVTPAPALVDLTGAGATFPYPLYARWFGNYAWREGTRINYLAVGSGEGIRQLQAGTVDFGAADVPLTAAPSARATPAARAQAARTLQLPMVLGAVAVTYQLERTAPLHLSGAVLAEIFLGRITRWDDPRLTALNPGVPLPALPIRVIHRDDESGTTYIFSDYLSAVSPAWAQRAGRGATLTWPVGSGSTGNEGVAGSVKQTPGAIGYVEVVYARQNRLPVARLQNRAGRFVAPMPFEIASAATAGVGALEGDRWMTASLVDAPGASSYPMVAFSWLLLDPEAIGAAKARQLRDFVQWALTDGVEVATPMGYVPLPSVLAAGVQARLDRALGIPAPSGAAPR